MGRRERDTDGSRLRDARRESGLSLSDFASKLSYSRSYLSAVELGHLPETEQIVMAYETALGLERGSLQAGKQSVARVIHRMSALNAGSLEAAPIDFFELPADKLTLGSNEDVIKGALGLLARAAEAPASTEGIVLTTFSEVERFSGLEDLLHQWQAVQQSVMMQGWKITHIVRLNDNVDRSLTLIERMLPALVHKGEYRALFTDSAEPGPAIQDFYFVPGIGAVIAFATLNPDCQAVISVKEPAALRAIGETCHLLEAGARPLIEPISRENAAEFNSLIQRLEEIPGDRYLVRDAILRWPNEPPVSEDLLRSIPTYIHAGTTAEYEKRQSAFLSNVARFRYREIVIKARLEEIARASLLMHEGVLLFEGGEHFEPQAFTARIRNTIHELRTLPNLELALLDDEEVELIQAEHAQSVVYWLAKGGKELLVESWPKAESGESRHLHFAVHESSIASAFQEHFKNVWNRITPRNRDREYVIWWLERLLDPFEKAGI